MTYLWGTRHTADRFSPHGDTIFRVPDGLRSKGHIVHILEPGQSLLYAIAKHRPDALIMGSYMAFLAVLLRPIHRLPVINCWNEILREVSEPLRWARPFIRTCEIIAAKGSIATITSSVQNAALAREAGSKGVYYLRNAYEADTEPTELQLKGKYCIVYLGDQTGWRRRNMDIMLDAVRNLPVTLYMVGPVGERAKVAAPVNVKFTGPVPRTEVQAVLAQADLLINCTDQDACCKDSEYAASGKPVLLYRGRGMKENVFTDGVNALIVDDVREGIRQMMAEPLIPSPAPLLSCKERAAQMVDIIEGASG